MGANTIAVWLKSCISRTQEDGQKTGVEIREYSQVKTKCTEIEINSGYSVFGDLHAQIYR